jgi:hypothetical protein
MSHQHKYTVVADRCHSGSRQGARKFYYPIRSQIEIGANMAVGGEKIMTKAKKQTSAVAI